MVIQQAQEIITEWLKGMGLELKPSKTKCSHTLEEYEGNVGFHFLGFEIRQYPVGRTHTGRNTRGKPLGFKTIIKPSKQAIQRHTQQIKEMLRKHKTAPQGAAIQHLNPVTRGWANYYSSVCSKQVFAWIDHQLYLKLMSWAKRRHRNKNVKWIANKYWHPEEGQWNFATPQGFRLYRYNETPIEQAVVHLFAQLGDEVQAVGHQQVLSERLGEIAFGAFEFAHQACGQLGNGMPIIDVARGEAKGQELALIVDNQVQLEAEEPTD